MTGCESVNTTGLMPAEAGVAMSTTSRNEGSSGAVPETVEAIQDFTAALYRRIAQSRGNLVFSPYSVAMALAMARNGARGRTAQEMDSVLRCSALQRFNGGMNSLAQQLESRARPQPGADGKPAELTLDVASSMWGQHGVQWRPGFLDALAKHYATGMRLVDYRSDPAGAVALINRWTSDKTRGKITRIVTADDIDVMTRLVLVNALYFKAPWQEPFSKGSTRRQPFTTADGSKVDVDLMTHDFRSAGFTSGPGWQAARLGYLGGDIAMAVVVPDRQTPLSVFEDILDGPGLNQVLGSFAAVPTIRVELPRWKFRVRASLEDQLTALGMPLAFSRRADFSGMTTEEELKISSVLHEAFIAVDEAGTEAAAATAVVMAATSFPAEPPLVLTADRAFLFVLFDTATRTPLFIGRVADPSQG